VRYQAVLALALALVASWRPILADEPSADSGWELPKLPHLTLSTREDWYGPQAKLLGVEGRVLVAFDITAAGATKNVSILWGENALLGAHTTRLLSGVHFDVPKDWATSGAGRRWRVGFVYCLVPSGQSDEFAIPVEKVYINGSRLPGAPVHTSPPPKASGQCGSASR
jgi:hypothetical protein